jgi:hypothetical protein
LKKPWYKSKVVWFNAASAALVAIEASIHVMQELLGPSVYLAMVGVIAAGNVILRTMTTQGIRR